MEPLRVSEVLEATHGILIKGSEEGWIRGISTDTRKIKKDELFIALKGKHYDGHTFCEEAALKGACGVVVSEVKETTPPIIIRVEDTLKALGDIASLYRRKFNIPLIAITGSNGKTTTKEMIAAILSRKFNTLRSEGSYNNKVGVPLTLFRLERKHEVAVVEMGMSGRGEIRSLAEISNPTIGVITNIGEAHLEYLGSLEAIAQAKGELLDVMGEEGVAVLNQDDPYLSKLSGNFRGKIVTFGVKDKSANFFATGIRELGHDGVEFTLNKRFPPSSVKIKIPLLGLHNVYNALASVATTQEFSLPLEDIREALLTLKPSPLRMELIEVEGITIINDTYNANPTSMKSAINTLISLPCRGRRVVVMGDMLELGDAGGAFHEEIGVVIKEAGVDFLFTFGELASFTAIRAEAEGFPRERLFKFATKEVMVKHLLTLLQPGDIILVKGSRAMKLEEVVDMLRIRLERR